MAGLGGATSAEAAAPTLVLVPVGSLEQHGPHLPLDTDTVIAVAVAEGAATLLGTDEHRVWVAPAVAYGSSGEHQSFAGTCSIGTPVLQQVLVELVRSIRCWAPRVLLVNGHGGNLPAVRAAVDQLVAEGHGPGGVSWVACATEGVDLHAGRTETSLLMHLRPGAVRLERAEAGCTAPLAEILPAMVAGGVAAVSANGVLGDPAGASAEEGARVLAAMVDDVVSCVATGAAARVRP